MIKIFAIIFVVLGGLYSLLLNVVKYRSANNPTPENVSDVYDSETYEKWKSYSAEHCRLGIISTIVSCVISLVMLATNVYSAFASLFPEGVFWQLLAVVIIELAVGSVADIIKSYVSVMVIEEKYGFNRSSVKTFVVDCIRSILLGFVLTLGLSVLMAAFHLWMGDYLIVFFAVAVFGISILISFLYPILSRIGNKFTPLEDGDLKNKLMELLNKHGYKVKAIEVMDASRRTTKLNAYFTGFGKLKTIVLYDNLLNSMTEDEICAIFAHELGHGLHKDVLKGQILNGGYMLIMSTVVWAIVREPKIYTEFGFDGVNYGFAFILVGIALSLVQPLISIVINYFSRSNEYRADRQAVAEGYGEAMITAFKKLAKDNFSHLSPSKLNVIMEYSHPPLGDRVDAVMKELSKNGQ